MKYVAKYRDILRDGVLLSRTLSIPCITGCISSVAIWIFFSCQRNKCVLYIALKLMFCRLFHNDFVITRSIHNRELPIIGQLLYGIYL